MSEIVNISGKYCFNVKKCPNCDFTIVVSEDNPSDYYQWDPSDYCGLNPSDYEEENPSDLNFSIFLKVYPDFKNMFDYIMQNKNPSEDFIENPFDNLSEVQEVLTFCERCKALTIWKYPLDIYLEEEGYILTEDLPDKKVNEIKSVFDSPVMTLLHYDDTEGEEGFKPVFINRLPLDIRELQAEAYFDFHDNPPTLYTYPDDSSWDDLIDDIIGDNLIWPPVEPVGKCWICGVTPIKNVYTCRCDDDRWCNACENWDIFCICWCEKCQKKIKWCKCICESCGKKPCKCCSRCRKPFSCDCSWKLDPDNSIFCSCEPRYCPKCNMVCSSCVCPQRCFKCEKLLEDCTCCCICSRQEEYCDCCKVCYKLKSECICYYPYYYPSYYDPYYGYLIRFFSGFLNKLSEEDIDILYKEHEQKINNLNDEEKEDYLINLVESGELNVDEAFALSYKFHIGN